jgi:hypothetical protein
MTKYLGKMGYSGLNDTAAPAPMFREPLLCREPGLERYNFYFVRMFIRGPLISHELGLLRPFGL